MIEIKSNDLKNDLEIRLGKEFEKILVEDLNKIKDLSISKLNYLAQPTDCILEDLESFKNLTNCSLFKFDIKESDIEILRRIQSLRYIYFDFCNLNIDKLGLDQSVSQLCFNMCESFELSKLENTLSKEIIAIGDKEEKLEIDISELKSAINLEELEIHNFKIKNILSILQIAPNLKSLNLDGSILEDVDAINALKEKIEISIEAEYLVEA